MKLIRLCFASLVLFVISGPAAPGASLEVHSSAPTKTSVLTHGKRHRPILARREIYLEPLACNGVVFPRSPRCGPRPFYDFRWWY